ncbi:TetR family transcriptional regulator [Enterococcus saccharolyticus]|uniref:TetR family transcriptional regulator n=1 Tax=Candidatus Enterococcus willemsii TaxID=1857215 RepID=A0ABQ6YZZ7_9ENTE|nr:MULTISPECIES: TetR family transcriptional regulator [Enterococcus]KAF1304196.1 TetR family transcriptional regulator [Enterococcus sp. CU12B]MCD5002110.1 TetR family transcriptional regulator [Enterococcus saccharolyticus]
MPKETFLNLPEEKKVHIDHILLEKFYNRHISQVKVSEIVEAMQMSRGAFYKYFQDLEDAYTYLVGKYSTVVHGNILTSINEHKNDFFLGIEQFLITCSQAQPTSEYWQILQLLTRNNVLQASKRVPISPDSPMIVQWLELLRLNHFEIDTTEEAVSFLYFIMSLVMSTLTDFIVNQWTTEELVTDFRFRQRWLTHGIVGK